MEGDIRVLVVDETPGLAQELLLAFRRRKPSVRVLGPVPDAAEANLVLDEGVAELVVVDVDREDGRGVEVVTEIRAAHEETHVLASTASSGPEVAAGALAAGACGVVAAGADGAAIWDAVRRALAGELVLPALHLPVVVERLRGRTAGESERLSSLTAREREILTALAEGASTADIAGRLSITTTTVQSHVKNVLVKLGVHSKVEAVRVALRAGIGTTTRSA
jgi:two-component system, NarL family, response regulator DevR